MKACKFRSLTSRISPYSTIISVQDFECAIIFTGFIDYNQFLKMKLPFIVGIWKIKT